MLIDINSNYSLAKDISVVHNAGPEGEQAIALRMASNFIVCLRCSIKGFQDTLYTHPVWLTIFSTIVTYLLRYILFLVQPWWLFKIQQYMLGDHSIGNKL